MKIWKVIVPLFLIFAANKPKKKPRTYPAAQTLFDAPITPMQVRYDQKGSGDFGAPRGGRPHNGIDFSSYTGQSIKAPTNGRVLRTAFPYGNDRRYSGLLIKADTGEQIKIFYIQPGANVVNTRVRAGDEIGIAQDIKLKYGQGMTNHIHIEIMKNGVQVNPYPYFFTV